MLASEMVLKSTWNGSFTMLKSELNGSKRFISDFDGFVLSRFEGVWSRTCFFVCSSWTFLLERAYEQITNSFEADPLRNWLEVKSEASCVLQLDLWMKQHLSIRMFDSLVSGGRRSKVKGHCDYMASHSHKRKSLRGNRRMFLQTWPLQVKGHRDLRKRTENS